MRQIICLAGVYSPSSTERQVIHCLAMIPVSTNVYRLQTISLIELEEEKM